ncbi:MAG: Dabb family protein [Cyclobacteriaceae bacterium]|nr:Dabb family protein [Cyclobacteriaceae bacterium]
MIKRRSFIHQASMLAAAASAFGFTFEQSQSHHFSTQPKNKNRMLQHNVFFYLKEGVNAGQKLAFEKGMKHFLSSVSEIDHWEIGIAAGTAPREVVDHSFDYNLTVRFTSIANHNIYQEHPAHAVFINDFAELWQQVKVYDVEIL